MSTQQLVDELLSLPLPERVDVAQTLWQSINQAPGVDTIEEEREAIAEAKRRDAELTSSAVVGRSHEEVMTNVRRVLGCG
jgi:putative addiction module component (TIGR02574 family)